MTTATDARRAQRKPMLTIGELVWPGKDPGVECTVLDLSTTGAKLKLNTATKRAFEPTLALPETFRLRIARDNVVMDCRLAWRDGDSIGVAFTSSFRPLKAAPTRKR